MKRYLISAGLVIAVLALDLTAMPAQLAFAQEVEEVVVTGSRIGRASDFESPSPITTVDREYIEDSGYVNLQQLLEKIPAAGNGTFSTRGNNQDSTANGASAVSLRGLGADATLVLVNGRRVAISSFAESITTNFVDINSIPVAAIERVEVLKDGASAVYGSDAVAGVVNIVLRKNFEGFEFTAGYGDTSESDNDETMLTAIWGTGSADGNVTMIFDYFKNGTLFNADRPKLATANQSSRGGEDFRSSRGFPGTFIVDGVTTVDPTCPPDRDVGVCVFDYGPFNVLTPGAERTGLILLGNRDFGADMELFTEIAVQHNRSIAQGAPTPLDDSAGLTVPVTHPDNPFTGATTIDVFRFRPVDAGPRQWSIESDNLRMLLGLRGEFNNWDWEVAASHGRSESLQTGSRSQGWVRTDFLQAEIDAGNYNIFGTTFNSMDVLDRVRTSLARQGNSTLKTYDATISGEIYEMPAGALLMAAGLEYREESISDVPDDQFQRGLIFGTESVSAASSRDNFSAFVEFSLPVLENFELQLAGRFDDYSDFGTTTNPKVAARWDVNDMFAVRGSWGQGFRAPSLAQIGLGPSQESLFFEDTYGCAVNLAYCATTDYLVIFSGNPDLQAEESETFNFGVTLNPIEDLSVSFDYWDITQEKKIDDVPFGFLYTSFCNDQNSSVCVRGAPQPGESLGPLQSVSTSFVNIGEQSVSGFDLLASYTTDVGPGSLDLNLYYAFLLDFDRVELDSSGTTFVTRSLAGEYEYPETRWSFSGNYQAGDWGLFGQLDYIGEFEDTPDADFDGVLDFDTNASRKVDSFLTLNVQASYTGIENTRLMIGIDNLLDEEPPFAIGDGDSDLYGYVQSQHSPRGMFWYVRANFSY
ncbi:MAG: TonB-dependent receptor [Gammaproteobacteria bacterium]|nr:TonB-dependent receptor [Gammaproteobacteria bacterium]MBT8110416.1 TonB-dependent receptor [Gammaproteobacteria bacterium]NND46576.1 TonB-dependent receptor [Woeseiaceae bacterium]NNL45116.1 TonB-dependent receptor [Woeseiaceae bacterium]